MTRLLRTAVAGVAAAAALLLFPAGAEALLAKHQCSFCHSLHGSDTGFVPRSDSVNLEVLCMGCHLTANGTTQAVQPHRGDGSTFADHYSTCSDCHDVHDNQPNWRKNDPNHAAQDNALGRNGTDVRPGGWPVGVNTKMLGRRDPDGQTPYAIVLTKEKDFNKDGVPDRNSTVTQSCNPRLENDCYVTRKRHVIFENRDATDSTHTIHAWADNNEDGKKPSDALAWGETITDWGDTLGGPHDAICHMCHTVASKNSCGYDGAANCVVHNPQRTCTDCHTHGGCFDRGAACAKFTMPNRDLRANSLAASAYAVNTGQTVTLTANVTNSGAIAEPNVTVKFNSNVDGYLGQVVIPSLAAAASQNSVLQWLPGKAGSHTVSATVQPVLNEVNVTNNTATAPQPVVATITPNHDVAVTSVSAPTPIQQGNTVNVTVNVSNPGTFTETFNVTLTSNQAGKGNLPLTQTVTNLAAGGTAALTFAWNTTGATLASHTLTATASTVTGETNTANNSASASVVVAVHDVAVTSVTAPAQVEQGASATVSVVVSNNSGAGGFTETFNVTLVSSVDGTIQTLGSGMLAAGGSTTLNFTWPVAAGAPLGLRTLTATAATVTGETNTANNSASTTSTVVAPVAHDVAVNSVTAPATINRGGGATTVAVVVANNGGITETFNVTLASNRDGTIQTLSSGPLAAGNSTTLNFTWTTTTATSLGSHTLTATAATVPGETNTANNSASTTTTVTSHDVAVNSVTAPASTPLGNTVTVSVQVQNVGSFTETFNVTLASNQSLDGNLPLTLSSGALAPGATTTLNFSWNTTGAFVGTHTLTATAATVTGELNTANNSASTTAAITSHDVAINSISANPTTVTRGATVTVTVVAANVGSFTETFNVTLTSNQPLDGNLPLTLSSGALAPGATTQLVFSWSTTGATRATHTLTATAATVTGETNTTNNTRTTTVVVN